MLFVGEKMQILTWNDLNNSDKESLVRFYFLTQLELLTTLDDHFRKQKTGIKAWLGERTRIQIPANLMAQMQAKAIDEARFLSRKNK